MEYIVRDMKWRVFWKFADKGEVRNFLRKANISHLKYVILEEKEYLDLLLFKIPLSSNTYKIDLSNIEDLFIF